MEFNSSCRVCANLLLSLLVLLYVCVAVEGSQYYDYEITATKSWVDYRADGSDRLELSAKVSNTGTGLISVDNGCTISYTVLNARRTDEYLYIPASEKRTIYSGYFSISKLSKGTYSYTISLECDGSSGKTEKTAKGTFFYNPDDDVPYYSLVYGMSTRTLSTSGKYKIFTLEDGNKIWFSLVNGAHYIQLSNGKFSILGRYRTTSNAYYYRSGNKDPETGQRIYYFRMRKDNWGLEEGDIRNYDWSVKQWVDI